jgi:hypothetical protein
LIILIKIRFLFGKMHPEISIKVGPVIGKVTDSTARILA